jgi:hypothetical protein
MSDEPIVPDAEDEPENEVATDELSDADLDAVAGGAEIVSPRDPASGLPTGKR